MTGVIMAVVIMAGVIMAVDIMARVIMEDMGDMEDMDIIVEVATNFAIERL